MRGVEAPRPLDGARREDQRAAGMPVQRQVVRGGAWPVVRAVVQQVLRHAERGCGQPRQARGPEAVVEVFVPFVAERALWHGGNAAGRQRRDGGVPPEAQMRVLGGYANRVGAAIDGEDGAAQPILRSSTVGGRTE